MSNILHKFNTPMMKQYVKIKQQYSDCLIFFRLGDFYELFMDDAEIGSQVLDITLTARPNGKDGKVPMAGVPYHAVDSYLAKLVKAGYKVAICEQVSEPNKYGIVDREVVRVVTPGTMLDEKALEKKENNYLISLYYDQHSFSISYADISTGELFTIQKNYQNLANAIQNELIQINASECILSHEHYQNHELLKILKRQKGLNIFPFLDWDKYTFEPAKYLKDHFKIKTLASFDIEDKYLSQLTSAVLLGYLNQTQKGNISHIKKITSVEQRSYVLLDRSTIINLELFSTIRDNNTTGTLLWVIDQTKTAMGGRLLKQWMKYPLTSKNLITKRLDAVEELYKNLSLKRDIQEILSAINDIERIFSRLSVGIGNARDMTNLSENLKKVMIIKHKLVKADSAFLQNIQKNISTKLAEIINQIDKTLVSDPPVSIKEGNIIRAGVNPKLDKFKNIITKSKQWVVDLEKIERQKTGISSLKVRFNKVFGFYIEISKSNLHLVPDNYIRKQTLVNCERFITLELKKEEEIILANDDKIKTLEYEIYCKLLESIKTYTVEIQKSAIAVAKIDCILSFVEIALKNNYVRPKIIYSGEIRIKDGRHPVVEKLLEDDSFIPNSVHLNNIDQSVLIITGPNMAGKSVFIRQTALIVLMSHIGSFVPAKSAHISLVDRIFVRSGASDVITSGLSTFMVEMVETSYILNNASKKSLIIMDEIGRGTSTYDGISIAWAVAEYLATHYKTSPKTLFATHYHELQALEDSFGKKIKNYHMAVLQEDSEPIFLHTLKRGAADHSFGVAVAKQAGIPIEVIEKAYSLLPILESRQNTSLKTLKPKNLKIVELTKTDINKITPIDALNLVAKLKEKYG